MDSTADMDQFAQRGQSSNSKAPPIASGARLVLGTAQLAAPYGSAIQVSPPDTGEATQLVRMAIQYGALAVDTGRAYPGAEEALNVALANGWGSRVKVVTKLSPLNDLTASTTPEQAAVAAEASVRRSLDALGFPNPWLLLHRAEHLKAWDGAVWARLKMLKKDGLVAGLGVSVQSPDEALTAAGDPAVELIQLPFNLLDWRWRQAGVPSVLGQRPDLEVHVRSAYLQGVLLRDIHQWPLIEGLEPDAVVEAMHNLVRVLQRESVADLCLAYVRAKPWIDGVVVGMERLAQLEENAALFSNPPLNQEEIELTEESMPVVPTALLDPSQWPPLTPI